MTDVLRDFPLSPSANRRKHPVPRTPLPPPRDLGIHRPVHGAPRAASLRCHSRSGSEDGSIFIWETESGRLVDTKHKEYAPDVPVVMRTADSRRFWARALCQTFPFSLGLALVGECVIVVGGDALERKGPQRRPQRRFNDGLEEVAKAVGGGYCRLQMPLKQALAVRGTVAGQRQGALEGGGSPPPPLPMHPWWCACLKSVTVVPNAVYHCKGIRTVNC